MEFLKAAYKAKWVTIEQLREFVEYGEITPADFEEITGMVY